MAFLRPSPWSYTLGTLPTVRTSTYIHVHAHVHAHAHTHTCACACTCACTCTCTCACTYACTCTCTCDMSMSRLACDGHDDGGPLIRCAMVRNVRHCMVLIRGSGARRSSWRGGFHIFASYSEISLVSHPSLGPAGPPGFACHSRVTDVAAPGLGLYSLSLFLTVHFPLTCTL